MTNGHSLSICGLEYQWQPHLRSKLRQRDHFFALAKITKRLVQQHARSPPVSQRLHSSHYRPEVAYIAARRLRGAWRFFCLPDLGAVSENQAVSGNQAVSDNQAHARFLQARAALAPVVAIERLGLART